MLREDDTRAKLVDPKLHESGWKEEMIERGRCITPGKLIDEQGKRKKGTEIDYILYYNSVPIAVVEAEPESKSALSGMGQAKDDAENYMHVPFAYSTNGHEIEEFDFTTNTQRTLSRFPTPEELWERYLKYKFKEKLTEVKLDPLTYPYHHLTGGKYPWYFQEVAIRKVIEAILNDKKRILLTMATGSGKHM
jgi:type I restriction enzyme R subunit